jgi:nitronate monooxygenase
VASAESEHLPLGVGFQTWAGDLNVAEDTLRKNKVAVVWLFAPRHGQTELDEWTRGIRKVSPGTQIWIQVASVKDAVIAASSKDTPDALVIQGADAGGHSLTKGAGIITLLPELSEALEVLGSGAEKIPLIAAGGIIDSRGAAAAFTLGASGVAIGTRLLACREATINAGYQTHVLNAADGGQNTVRTQLHNHLRGTTNWPEAFDARGLINQSWRDHEAGMPFEKNKMLHMEAMKKGSEAWGDQGRTATYAGTGIGLVREVKSAETIVKEMRNGIGDVLNRARDLAHV